MKPWLGFVAIAAVVAAGEARADPVDDVTRAREQFVAGLQLEDSGKWPAALEAFRAVAAVRPTPQVRYHLGLCLEHTGHFVDALAELGRAEKDAKDSTDPEQQLVSARAGQRAAQIRGRTPRIAIANADGGSVTVDGEPKVLAHGALAVDPGAHRIVVTRDGATLLETTVAAREQDPAQVIALDVPVPADGHVTTALDVAPWIAGGVAVLALAGAGTTALLRSSALSDLDGSCGADKRQCPESLRSTYDRASTLTTVTNVLLIGAGVAAIAAGTLFILGRQAH